MPAALPHPQPLRTTSCFITSQSGRRSWRVRPAASRLLTLLLLLLSGATTAALAQANRFVTHDDGNQVPANTAKAGNVIPNDENPDNLPNSAFVVTLVSGPTHGTLTSFNANGSYVYTPNAGYLGQDSFTYQICQPGATPTCSNTSTVVLNIYDQNKVCTLGTGRNLLKNSSFTEGNVSFTTDYRFVPSPTAQPELRVEGGYAVDTDAALYSFRARFRGTGRTGAGDRFMFVNGGASLAKVYSQAVTVLPNRYYLFSVYATSTDEVSPAQLALVVDGKSTSAVTTLPATVGPYVRISDLYFSGPGPASGFPVTLEIRDVNKAPDGNDFGIDDLYFGSCSTLLLADAKTTAPVPNAAVPAALEPLSATFDASGSVGVRVASFTIQSLPATGTLAYNGVPVVLGQEIPVGRPGDLNSGGSLTYTPVGGCGAGSVTFKYSATKSDGEGSNNIADYTIPLSPVPPAAIRIRTQGENPFCEGQQVGLSAGPRPGYRYTWYNGSTVVNGAGAVLNDSTFTATTPGTYTVKAELAECSTTSTPLSVSTKACPQGGTGAAAEECSQDEKFINTWYFGQRAGLNFNEATDSIPPAVLTNSSMVAPAGSGVMSDGGGNLLFYSNGDSIWSRNHSLMPGGTGLGGNRLATDGPLAIRRPGSPANPGEPTRYFLFTQDAQGGPKGLSYSEIVIPDGQQGEVVAATKNTPLTRGTAEKMTGVLHKNGCDIWIIVHGWGTGSSGTENRGDSFLAYRVTPAGVQPTPVISTIGPRHAPGVAAQGYRGQMKVSPDGQQLAVARFSEALGDSSSTVELFAFDAATGVVSNRRAVDSGAGRYYGVEFSPGRNRLYATVQSPPQLLQFDLSAADVPASKQAIPLKQATPANLGSLQAGPDGKVYVARENQPALGFIAYPDSLGAAVAYADDSLTLGGRRSGLGLPNFNQSSLLRAGFGAQLTACQQISFEAGSPIPNPESYAWTFADRNGNILGSSTIEKPVFTFPAPGDYLITLRITNFCFCREVKGLIRVPGLPTPGSIAGPQTLCAGAPAAELTSTASAAGDAGLPLVYQWESSTDNVSFTPIGGATSASYLPPSSLPPGTTYFRRRAQLLLPTGQAPYCAPSFTPSVAITVLPPLAAGSIAADQTVCAGAPASPLTSTVAPTGGGGAGSYRYRWESSPDQATWTPLTNTDNPTFDPGVLTATTFFRRQVSSGDCGALPSNVVKVTVLPALTAGTIAGDQPLCAGTSPTPLTSETPPTGSTAYQWESSPDGVRWTPIDGATGLTFAPGPLTTTTSYRRRVGAAGNSGCPPVFSNTVTITVAPALTAGTVGPNQNICTGSTPTPLSSATSPGGGTGTFTYQWELSPDQVTWTEIPGATGETFAPGPVSSTTYFRRRVSSGLCGAAYSNTATVATLPDLLARSLAPATQDICAGATPAPLASTEAGGGTGTYRYQWESSPDQVSWQEINGATNLTLQPGPLTATTYFRLRVTSGSSSCSTAFSEPAVVRVQPIVTTGVSLDAPPVQCPGTTLTFTAVPTNAGNAPTYRWLVNNVLVATGPTFSTTALATGDQVRVELTPTPGLCSTGPAAATVTINRTPVPQPTLAIAVQPGGPVCPGTPLTFSIAGVSEPGPAPAYQWQVDGNDVAGATGPVFTSTTLREGQTVTLRLRTTTACDQPATAVSNGIAVRISPPADVDAGPDKEILAGASVTLEGRADGSYPVTWTPAEGLTFPGNDRLRPVASPLVTTIYTLSAGADGCADSDQVTVTVRPAIRIPNAFTPNNDGRDDTWQIEFIEQYPDNTVSVFNRWGNRVFSATNYSRANEWRGDINGQPAPVGTYYYVIVTKGPLGKSYSGPITILY